MKRLSTLWLLILIICKCLPLEAQHRHSADSARVILAFRQKPRSASGIDSAMVIFDKFSLNGAGIVYNILKPARNDVVLDSVPTGKYYVSVICFGPRKQQLSKIVYISSRKKNNIIRLKVQPFDAYEPGTAYIPPEKIRLSRLKITRESGFRP